MILNNGLKRDEFLRGISLRLTGTPEYNEATTDRPTITFGPFLGYWDWQAKESIWKNVPALVIAISLINPDKSPAQIAIVEEALSILGCGEYKETP